MFSFYLEKNCNLKLKIHLENICFELVTTSKKLAVVFSLFFSLFSYSQVSTYSFSETLGTYTALTTPTPSVAYATPWDNNTNGAAFLANIGFNFVFDGSNQTQCYISPNGFITFGAQALGTTYIPLSDAAIYTNGGAVSALGMDLISTTDNIVYSTIGTSPNRTFVVEWKNARRKSLTGNFNFQIRLSETSNVIQISYGSCAPDDVTVLNAQVGIRGNTNDFLQGNVKNRFQTGANVNTTWFNKTIAGTANSNTVRTSVTEYPNSGLLYTFTPSSTCVSPTGAASNLIIGGTTVTTSSFVGNSFTAASPASTNYLVVRSLTNTPPTASNIPNRVYWSVGDVISGNYTVISTSNATSFTETGLTSNTTYYYWVIPYNSGCLGGPLYYLVAMASNSNTTCSDAPTGLTTSGILGNSFTASWDAVPGAIDYRIDVSTTSNFSTILPAYNNLLVGGLTTINVTGLNPTTTYYYRIRVAGSNCFNYSTTASLTTLCGAFPIPYFQNFDGTPVNITPTCFTIANYNADSVLWQVKNSIASSAPNAIHLSTNTTVDSDDWFFLPGLSLTSGVTYRLKFKYNTLSAGLYAENLRVRLGNGPSDANMSITILDLSSILNTVYQTAFVDFTPVSTGVYYIGFQGYSFANQSKIAVDDISVIVSPTCFEPTNLTVNSVSSNSASISWDAAVPPPSNGYQYYVSTSSNLPGSTVTPTGSVGTGITTASISGLSPATLYYVWVRGNCGGSDQSVWSLIQSFSTDCSAPSLLPVVNGTLCGGGSTTLQATPSGGATIEWFSDAAGTNLVSTGNNYLTPTLFSTTTYYAQSRAPGGIVSVGPLSPTTQGGALGSDNLQTFVSFTVNSSTVFQSLDIYPLVSGQSGVFTIKNSSNIVLGTYSFVTSTAGGATAQTISLGLSLGAGNYTISFDTLPAGGLIINNENSSYPYSSTIANITGNGYDNTYLMYAYNWKFSNICRSLLTPVTATVTSAPAVSLSQTTATICYGVPTSVVTVSGYSSYNTFVWSPSTGVSGTAATGYTFNPTTSTNYTLTLSQTSGSLCSTQLSINITVKPEPPGISIVPASATFCQGTVQVLNAALAAATPAVIYEEKFNNTTNNWLTTNLSVGGIVANSSWTLRNSPYTYTSAYWNTTLSSNDASKFYFTNSDAQGSPGTNKTITYLESPSISFAGYTSATLTFYHYLRFIPGNKARVEVSVNAGPWTQIANFTSSQGTASNFTQATIDMSSYAGNSSVKIRFYYDASWDYGWAVDNVKITGNLAVEVTWAPATGLYFDSAATSPYIAGTPAASVYAKPAVTTVYTGTVLGANGCFASGTSTLTVNSNPTLGTLSSNQTICANWAPADLVLTGYSNAIVRWEYASDAAFTSGLTTIANTTNTLTAAQMGTFTGPRYFRAVLQNGICPTVNTGSVVITTPQTTWNGTSWNNGVPTSSTKAVFMGNYSSTASLQACSVEVISGTVIFNSGHTLIVDNDVKVSGGSLVFQNNASLVQINTLNNLGVQFTNTGNITYKRTSTPVRKYDYTYWSTPVSPQTMMDFSSGSTLFYIFDPTIGNWVYAPSNVPMIPAKGYLIRTPDIAPFNTTTANYFFGSFIGVPNTGTISIPIVGGALQFNLIGNPYPSALSANSFLSDAANVPVIDATIYLWTHNTLITNNVYNAADYAMYNYSGGVGTGSSAITSGNNAVPNGKIASGQGFFIKGLSSGNAVFKNSMRINGNNDQFFRMSNPPTQNTADELEAHRFWLDISNTTGGYKQLLVAYIENATDGIDRGFDGEMVDIGNSITLYVKQDALKLSIQGRALPFADSDIIPLGYRSSADGSYQIQLSNFDGLFLNQNIYLVDHLLNVVHDIKASPYSFTTLAGTFENRFEIQFTNSALGTTTFNTNQVIIYKDGQSDFVVTTGQTQMQSIKVFDVRGRLLLEQKNINDATTRFNGGEVNEVLLVQITTVDGVTVTKKVIR
ncbi:fibronectin type III domain-containing protein [Flavobacterium capsici]|uniref:Fibronectin type III domain-containing protein n=1 Tax=Flavobacterium capsici TaxID=3075618 RepID=A0AA96F2A4_9FLAO|nr:fibronectin type III domain-containing protein [Flavobacterium sp. PMTSA4]WNM22839.1 fibronectin type III domain-containing protein [Flavobacterium sp. PMTSA4]